ncbi:MAG: transposase [Saprospiraceae bacterium]|nr:transposase [Saprospiraceae bacterium]
MSKDKAQYDVFKGLLSGGQVHTLSSDVLLEAIRDAAIVSLGAATRTYVLHDGSDIRKPNAQDMAHLGKVMSLQKQVISGYKTMNSVAVDMTGKELTLIDHTTYSTAQPNYLTQELVNDLRKNPSKDPDLADKIAKGDYLNNSTVYLQSVLNSHNTVKRAHLDIKITHIQDREFDSESCFEYVDDLGDEFITRLKLSRLSNHTQPIFTPKGKLSCRVSYEKLIDTAFKHATEYAIKRVTIKNKTYTNVKCRIEWDKLVLNNRNYSVIRIALMNEKGQPIFQQPMMLITNRPIQTAQDAQQVYQAYLLRFKIEVVFRFLKTNLGWETFQVRDFETIKNLIAWAFFLVGYFKELKEDIQKHEFYALIAKIGGGKGIISVNYLLKGIEKIAHFQQIQKLIDDNIITKEDIENAMRDFEQN